MSAPRDAATVVLLREAEGPPEILMVRRPRGSSFMADAWVFPGGRIDDSDAAAHPAFGGEWVERFVGVMAADAARAVACCIAAIREVFEETGLLLAVDEHGVPARPEQAWLDEARAAVHGGIRGFREVLAEAGLSLALDELTFFARWVTPPTEPRRFDARFFLARVPAGQRAAHDPGELVEHRWSTARGLIDDQAAGAIKLPPPTLFHLTDLAGHASAGESFERARATEVAIVRPKLVALGGMPAIVLPWDRDYETFGGDEGQAIAPGHPMARGAAVTRYLIENGRWVGRAAT